MNWRDYEIYITRHFQKLFPGTSIQHNVRRKGLYSQVQRQIDILIEGNIAGFQISVIIDCKYFNKKLDVKHVESFLSFLQDLKASKGVLITNKGYSKAAYNRATYDSQDIDLRIIDFQALETFQCFFAVPYVNSDCAFISSPPGWIIDGRTEYRGFLASLYPAGLERGEAFHAEGFMYVNFAEKRQSMANLDALLESQKLDMTNRYAGLKIDSLKTIERDDCECKLRVADSKVMEKSKTLEYTLFLDFEEIIIFIVLLTPTSQSQSYLKKLEWVGEKLMRGKVIYDNSGHPYSAGLR